MFCDHAVWEKEVKDNDGKVVEKVDFDHVYRELIEKAVEGLGVDCDRCDEIIDNGPIIKKMFRGIFDADVTVVDITSLNPNVFYELGVRHALQDHVTLVICKNVNQAIPFNIRGLNILMYEIDTEEHLEHSRKKIREHIQAGMDKGTTDSIVHESLDDLRVGRRPKAIETIEEKLYKLFNVPGKEIGYITGNIKKVKNVDVWVNSENTNMQMARPYERSISATIRYEGAKKDRSGYIVDDLIAKDLQAATGGRDATPGAVIPTTSGELARTNKVKRIFHAASVFGQPGEGYKPINNITDCISNALALIDNDEELANEEMQSILFPLMGTGTTRLNAQGIADGLIDAALAYLEQIRIPRSIRYISLYTMNRIVKSVVTNLSMILKSQR